MAEPEPRLPRRLPDELPVERHELDTAYHRIHRSAHDALWFGPAPGDPPLGRFDDPDGGAFRTLCASTGPESAFAETFLRDRAPVRLLSVRSLAWLATLPRDFARGTGPLRGSDIRVRGVGQIGRQSWENVGPCGPSGAGAHVSIAQRG